MQQKNLRGVEMNRREFIEKALVTCSAVLAFGLNVAKAVVPRRFIWAKPLGKYPGRLKARSGRQRHESKWSG